MPRPPDHDPLLADVLAEAEPADFRAALLGETLRLARRRRIGRRVRRSALVATIVLGAVTLGLWKNPPSSPAPAAVLPASPASAYTLIRSQIFPEAARVATQPFQPDRIVSSFAGVVTIRTPMADRFVRLIDDDELLALASPRPAALVRIGPATQELIFADVAEPADAR